MRRTGASKGAVMIESHHFLRLRDVERITGLSKSSVYRLEARSEFPIRVKLFTRASAWKASEVLAWLEARPRAARAGQAA